MSGWRCASTTGYRPSRGSSSTCTATVGTSSGRRSRRRHTPSTLNYSHLSNSSCGFREQLAPSRFNFFRFHAAFGKKNCQIIGWQTPSGVSKPLPPWEILDLPLNSSRNLRKYSRSQKFLFSVYFFRLNDCYKALSGSCYSH